MADHGRMFNTAAIGTQGTINYIGSWCTTARCLDRPAGGDTIPCIPGLQVQSGGNQTHRERKSNVAFSLKKGCLCSLTCLKVFFYFIPRNDTRSILLIDYSEGKMGATYMGVEPACMVLLLCISCFPVNQSSVHF